MSLPAQIPIFPLRTVLFPDSRLPLRIFEPRYISMVSRCLRENSGFGIAQIADGHEVGPARTVAIGTLARIVDFQPHTDGVLGIMVVGERRFRIESVCYQADGLQLGTVEWLAPEAAVPLPKTFEPLARSLQRILESEPQPSVGPPCRYDDVCWVTARLADLLPIPTAEKQALLELDDPLLRLVRLRNFMRG